MFLKEIVESGKTRTVIEYSYALSEVGEALKHVGGGRAPGADRHPHRKQVKQRLSKNLDQKDAMVPFHRSPTHALMYSRTLDCDLPRAATTSPAASTATPAQANVSPEMSHVFQRPRKAVGFRRRARPAIFLLAFMACGCSSSTSSDAGTGGASNTVTGTVMGYPFGAVASAYWIGMPSAGSLPTQIFLLGAPVDCVTISAALWDKALGNKPSLELGVNGTTPNTYRFDLTADAAVVDGGSLDAIASYLPNAMSVYNPTADSGTITIKTVNTMKNIVGSFELHFGTDVFTGTFDAVYCATGVEP